MGLSYYSIQKTLISSIKRSIFNEVAAMKKSKLGGNSKPLKAAISTDIWRELILDEKKALKKE